MDFDRMYSVNPGYGKSRFSSTELRDIFVSVVVLSLAFTIMYHDNGFATGFLMKYGNGAMYAGLFGMSLVLVTVSFLFHEMGHKFAAQKAGLWSEYRMYPMGLMLALVMSLIGFLFAAPGAVCIAGNMSRETNGKVSIAGPGVNIVFAAVSLVLCMVFNGSWLVVPFYLLASLNAFLAVFNLLPIPPLDGSKVMSWNKGIWVVAILIAAAELIALWTYVSPELYYFL